MRSSANLDFLRSVAVLLVVGSHSFLYNGLPQFAGWAGIVGVCMFFVHTSLVLMWSLERDPDAAHFYVRRAFRIYPLWLAVLALVLLLRLPQFPPFHFRMPGKEELVYNALLLCNLKYGPELVGASWTLPLEVQMYLFLPFLFFATRQMKAVWPLIVIDLFIMIYDWRMFPAYYSGLPMCLPYFLPGVMAYVLSKKSSLRVLPAFLFPPFLLISAGIAYRYGSFRGFWLFCLVLGFALPLFKDMTAKGVRKVSHYLAKYSYGIYLTHISALVVAVHMLGSYPRSVRVAAFLALTGVSSVVFYHFLEEPMIRLGSKLVRRLDERATSKITGPVLDLEPAP